MAQSVTTRQRRITLVEKSLSEVGDGTAYPMLATLDQIAEIFYRVKDAYFTAGQVNYIEVGGPPPTIGFTSIASTDAYSSRATNVDSYSIIRGYTTSADLIPARHEAYLQAQYDASQTGTSIFYRDIADKEHGVWMVGDAGVTNPDWNGSNLVNAFSWNSNDYATPSAYAISHYVGDYPNGAGLLTNGTTQVIFTNPIGVVKVNPTDSMVAPTNLYYLGVIFSIVAPGLFDTRISVFVSPIDTYIRYIIRLASGDISCPIYTEDGGGSFVSSGTDFIHEATEWFPYAKNSPPVPVWDATTGERLPDNPELLGFDENGNPLYTLVF